MRKQERDQDFAEFVTASWPRLQRAAYLLTHHHQDAEDLLQAVLVKAYVAWPRVRRAEAYSYVSRALVNAYIDSRRRDDRVRVTEDVPEPDVRSGEDLPEDRLADRTDLVRLLEPLSARERSMVVLRYYLDQSEAEVAAQLGVTVGTVKSTSSRALARLRGRTVASTSTSHDQERRTHP